MSHGSEKRIRSRHLTIRLTPEEREAIEAGAERAGLTAGSYARQIVLGAPTPRQVRRPPIERRELARLLGALGAIGNNLNQLARLGNTGELVEQRDLIEVFNSLLMMRDAVLKALGREP